MPNEDPKVTLRFLGTSHGLPEPDRFCSCALVETGETRYMIDAGAPPVSLCRRAGIPVQTIRACFVTHLHGDHANGLAEFTDYLNYFCKPDYDPEIYLPERAGVEALLRWVEVVGGGLRRPLSLYAYGPGQVYCRKGFALEARPSDHLKGARPAYSFAVTAGGRRILFSGDVSGPLDEFMAHAALERWDAVVIEAAHNDLDASAEKLAGLDTGLLIVNHINPRRNADRFGALARAVPFRCELARDGDVFEL